MCASSPFPLIIFFQAFNSLKENGTRHGGTRIENCVKIDTTDTRSGRCKLAEGKAD